MVSLSSFDCTKDTTTLAPRWKKWKRGFEFYLAARNIQNDGQKRALLLHTAGLEVQDVFDSLSDTGDSYANALEKLDAYFTPKKDVTHERRLLRRVQQSPGETVDQFLVTIRTRAKFCEYGDLESDMILEQMIEGCLSDDLRRKLGKPGMKLDRALEIARDMELRSQYMRMRQEPRM
jgi:hypothetical protein